MPDPTDPLAAMVAELRDLLAKATPGPWKQDAHYAVAEVPTGRPGGEVIVDCHPTVARLVADTAVLDNRANAALIVAAVNALPALLAEVAALREERGAAVDLLDWFAPSDSDLDAPATEYDIAVPCDKCGEDWPCPTVQARRLVAAAQAGGSSDG